MSNELTLAAERLRQAEPFLGTLKMLKPLRFLRPDVHWSDGFKQHGIFEVIAKNRKNGNGEWLCTLRRIGTCHDDSPIGEERTFAESWLELQVTYTDLSSFGYLAEHPDPPEGQPKPVTVIECVTGIIEASHEHDGVFEINIPGLPFRYSFGENAPAWVQAGVHVQSKTIIEQITPPTETE